MLLVVVWKQNVPLRLMYLNIWFLDDWHYFRRVCRGVALIKEVHHWGSGFKSLPYFQFSFWASCLQLNVWSLSFLLPCLTYFKDSPCKTTRLKKLYCKTLVLELDHSKRNMTNRLLKCNYTNMGFVSHKCPNKTTQKPTCSWDLFIRY